MTDAGTEQPSSLRRVALYGLVPLSLYFVAFCLLTWPLITLFRTHLFCDQGDGLQNVWNIWWVNRAVTELHTHPWYTRELHHPHGTTLIGQTLNPFNGFLAIPLLLFLSLTQAHNVAVVFAFVAGGWTAFMLCRHVGGSYAGSLVGGAVFTFSNYHFAHAQGHLQLVSLQWIPLFILCWLRFLDEPRARWALACAGSLLLVVLCDYYYCLCCIVTGALLLAARIWVRRRELYGELGVAWREGLTLPLRDLFRRVRQSELVTRVSRQALRPALVFVVATLSTSGLLVGALMLQMLRDPFRIGGHPPHEFSLDLLAPVIPGGHWRFHELTEGYWSGLRGVIHESSVHLGAGAILLALLGWRFGRGPGRPVGRWAVIALLFWAVALGPNLQIGGRIVSPLPLPYAWMETLFPPLALGGVPVRLFIIPILCAGILISLAFPALASRRWGGPLLGILGGMMLVEFLPSPMPATRISEPRHVALLRTLPGRDAVLDLAGDRQLGYYYPGGISIPLYYQTLYQKPQVFGYISRMPRSVGEKGNAIRRAFGRGQWGRMWHDWRIRWLVAHPSERIAELRPAPPRLYADPHVEVYDLSVLPREATLPRLLPGMGLPARPARPGERGAGPMGPVAAPGPSGPVGAGGTR